MRAIARNLTRSAALLCMATAFAYADAHDDVIGLVTSMAAALTEMSGTGDAVKGGNVPQFMAAFSKDMPDYDTLENNVTALVNNAEVSSTILPLEESFDGQTYKIDLDWLLEVRSLEQDGPLVRRRQVVHCELRREKKHWKIVALKPIEFFAPPSLGK